MSYQMWAHGGSWPPQPTVAPGRWKLWCICLSRPGAAGWGSTRCTCCPCCGRWAPRARRPSLPSPQSCAAASGNTLYSHLIEEKGKDDKNQSAPTGAALKFHALALLGWSASKTTRLIASWIRQRSSGRNDPVENMWPDELNSPHLPRLLTPYLFWLDFLARIPLSK